MANWLFNVYIGDLLSSSEDPEVAQRAGAEIARRVREQISKGLDEELDDILTDLQKQVPDIEEFNWCLDRLYDWGDHGHRLFLDTFTTPIGRGSNA